MEMSRKAANLIAASVSLKPDAVLGLATGDTPLGVYKCLIERHAGGEIDFSAATAFNLDEYRNIAPEAEQSYRRYMIDNLYSKIDMRPENRHIPDGLAADPATECERYEKLIAGCGGIDVQLLGIGHNGHIGFNEPGGEFVGNTHLVALSDSTIDANSRFFRRREDVPAEAYTMGIGTIMRARMIILVASGLGKAEIIHRALFGAVTPAVPASILQFHANVTIIGDAAALSMIDGI